jgi:quercetin dioxygenase-like cupin family protein
MNKLIVRKPEETHETLNMIGEQFTVLAAGEDTGSYEVFIQVVPPGAGPPLHSHPWDEAFYVVNGELNFSTDEQNLRAPVGTFVHFPAGRPHAFASRSGTSTILSFTSRPGAAAFFRESNRVNADFPGDLEKLFAVPAKHGVRLHESPQQFEKRTSLPPG